MNELPGRPLQKLPVHKKFHIVITTNPPGETHGREELPARFTAMPRE